MIPVVPQSLGTMYSSLGSNGSVRNRSLTFVEVRQPRLVELRRKPPLASVAENSAVGTAMSYWPLPPAWSLASSSSFDG